MTPSTLKVNYSPYLLDIILSNEIDPIKHKASVKDGLLQINLYKKHHIHWETLEAAVDKAKLSEIKKESLHIQSQIDEEWGAKRKEKQIGDERHAVRKQMALDEAERNKLENLKQEEKQEAEREVYDTFAKMNVQDPKKSVPKPRVSFAPAVTSTSSPSERKQEPLLEEKDGKHIFKDIDMLLDEDDIDDDVGISDSKRPNYTSIKGIAESDGGRTQEVTDEEVYFIPPPRSTGLSTDNESKVNIKFTPRIFPTPMRESKASEEEDWIAKNRRHLKQHGVIGKNISGGGDFSEEDPVWLKAKGDDFFR